VLLVLPEFELFSTVTVEETCALLSRFGEGTSVLAGGTDLLTKMKHRRSVPRRLINIKGIPNLNHIRHDEQIGLRIGSLTTVQAIEASSLVSMKFAALKQAAGLLGTTQIRNVGTIGGNLANASPSAEFATPLLVYDASVRCMGAVGERVIPMEALFVSPGKTSMNPDELLVEVHVPNLPTGAHGIYLKHSLRKMDVAIASAAVLIVIDGDVCSDVRIALGAVGPVPYRARKAEATLRGKRLTGGLAESELIEEVAQVASDESSPIDDFRGQAGYRRKLVAMLVGKGLERVVSSTRG